MAGIGDQLRKAGLVNEKQLKRAKQEVSQRRRKARKSGKKIDEREELVKQTREALERQRVEDRQREQARQEKLKEKERQLQVKQLIDYHGRNGGSQKFYFKLDERQISHIKVNPLIERRLINGEAVIIRSDREEPEFVAVPTEVCEKLRRIWDVRVYFQNERGAPPAQED